MPRLWRGFAEGFLRADIQMRDAAFLLPELFCRAASSFAYVPQQARTPYSARVASIRTSLQTPHAEFAECQARRRARALCQTRRLTHERLVVAVDLKEPAERLRFHAPSAQAIKKTKAGMCVALQRDNHAFKRTRHHLSRNGSALRRVAFPQPERSRRSRLARALEIGSRLARVASHGSAAPL